MKTRPLLLIIAAVASGCAQLGPPGAERPAPAAAPATRLVWPPPPDTARIEYVSSISGTPDVQRAKSFFRRLEEVVLGRSEDFLVRPTGVAVRGDLLAVADAGVPALFLFDRAAGRGTRITEEGDTTLVSPVGVAIGDDDTVYLADSYLRHVYVNDRNGRLRYVWGGDDMQRPTGLAFDAKRHRLYVVDTVAHHVAVYDNGGKLLFTFGSHGTGDGELNWPTHICIDRDGLLYVVDSFNFRIQSFDPDGHFLSKFGHHGDGSGDFARPKGIGIDSRGHIYVVDALFDAVQIFDRTGQLLLGFGRQGRDRGEFWLPVGLAIGAQDQIYVADAYNQRVQIFRYLGGADE